MNNENAINTVMSAFLGTASSLFAADTVSQARLGDFVHFALVPLLIICIIAGISINIISNCFYNYCMHNKFKSSHEAKLINIVRLGKNSVVLFFIFVAILIFSGAGYKEYTANIFDKYGFFLMICLAIWLVSLLLINRAAAKSSINSSPDKASTTEGVAQ
jgi:hypothetical protein